MKPINKSAALKKCILLNKEKLVRKLFLAEKKIHSKDNEIKKCNSELVDANKELAFQKHEIDVRKLELFAANKKLIFKTQERQLKTAELNIVNRELKKAEKKLKEYLKGMAEVKFLTSHKVRQPLANILGFSKMLDQTINTPDELKVSLNYIKESALTLDVYTRELTEFISELDKKENNSTN
jgi:signal transduction histidine kinase